MQSLFVTRLRMQWPDRAKLSNSLSFSLLRSGQVALCSIIFVTVFWAEADAANEGSTSLSGSSSSSSSTSSSSTSSSGSLSCGSSSGSGRRLAGRRLGSGPPWYCHEYEKDHIEAAAAAVMLVLAMGFEFAYHYFLHLAEHSFVYGQSMLSDEEKKAAVHRSLFGKPLRLILFSRMGGEFMVLGFLAFTIWTCNQQELFHAVAKIEASDIRTPTVASDILHLMEEVHMQLFVAMILYFTIVFRVVIVSDHRTQDFEVCRAAWIKQLFDGSGGENDDFNLRAFKLWRGHFSKGCLPVILKWRENKPQIFSEVMKSLQSEQEHADITLDDLQECFSARFSFCSYVVFSLGSCVLEVVNVTHETWLTVIILKGLYAFLHRVGKTPLVQIAPFFCLIAFIFISGLALVVHLYMKSLCNEEIQDVKGLAWLPGLIKRLSEYTNPQEVLLTAVQVFLFFLCHSWAGYMISKTFWEGAFRYGDADKILEAIIYPLVLCALAFILPKCIPEFAIVMSLPPFFSHKNEKVLQLVCVQVVDQEMVRARAAVRQRMQEANEESKVRLQTIYNGTRVTRVDNSIGPVSVARHNSEADDNVIQPFLDHNPVIQAQQVHKEPELKIRKKTKTTEMSKKFGSGTSAPKAPGSPKKGKDAVEVKVVGKQGTVLGKRT